jgi:hypothetical protein
MLDEVKAFIEDYRHALGRGARAIAELYAEPCLTVRMGVARVNTTRRDIERFFDDAGAHDRARGCTHGEIISLDVQPLGPHSALATVQWAHMGACEELLWKSTFSYNLYRRDGVWKILVETMHD